MVVYPESQLNFLMEDHDGNLQGTALTSLLQIITISISSHTSTQNPRLDVCGAGVLSDVLSLTKGLRRALKGYNHLETPLFVSVLGISCD